MKNSVIIYRIIVLLVNIFFGCVSRRAQADVINFNSTVKDGIEYYIQTDKSVYNLGQPVEIFFKVSNRTENTIDLGNILNLGVDCPAHYFIENTNNTVIWEFFRVIPPAGSRPFSLGPLETKENIIIKWNQVNDNGTFDPDDNFFVGPGFYMITGELYLGNMPDRVPVSVSIEIIPEPASVVLFGIGTLFLLYHKKVQKTPKAGGVFISSPD